MEKNMISKKLARSEVYIYIPKSKVRQCFCPDMTFVASTGFSSQVFIVEYLKTLQIESILIEIRTI